MALKHTGMINMNYTLTQYDLIIGEVEYDDFPHPNWLNTCIRRVYT